MASLQLPGMGHDCVQLAGIKHVTDVQMDLLWMQCPHFEEYRHVISSYMLAQLSSLCTSLGISSGILGCNISR